MEKACTADDHMGEVDCAALDGTRLASRAERVATDATWRQSRLCEGTPPLKRLERKEVGVLS